MAFIEDNMFGRNAERIYHYLYADMTHQNGIPSDISHENMEGMDIVSISLNGDAMKSVEVKALDSFLTRDNDNNEESGTLAFELWSHVYRENKEKYPRKEWKKGWFFSFAHPQEYSENAVSPNMLAFVLFEGGKYKKEPPFAVITFTDTKLLYDRLQEIFPWDLDKWNIPQAADGSWNRNGRTGNEFMYKTTDVNGMQIEGKTKVIVNMWHVPIAAVKDIPHVVTMIDNGQRKMPQVSKMQQLARKRYEYLEKLSNGWRTDYQKAQKNYKKITGEELITWEKNSEQVKVSKIDLNELEKYSNPEIEKEVEAFFADKKGWENALRATFRRTVEISKPTQKTDN